MSQQTTSQPYSRRLVSQLQQAFHPSQLLPSLVAGLVVGVLAVVTAISYAALIFSGDLARYVPAGIGIALFSAGTVSVIVALTSSFPGTVASVQDGPAAILALIAASIASGMSAAAVEETFATTVAAVALTSLLTGAFFLTLGLLKLGNLTRFVPYPVIGGFLAGTGWLLVRGGVDVMVDVPLSFSQLPYLLQSDVLVRWLPGLVFAVLLLLVLRRYTNFLVMPAMVLAAIGLFYALLWLTNTSLAEASAQGWLLGPFPERELWRPLTFSALAQVDWAVILQQTGNLGTILIISVISLLLNASGLELAVRRDIDLNRELRSAGFANLVTGLGGGLVGYHVLSDSALAHKMGANSRLVGLFSAALCGVTFYLGAPVLAFFPRSVVGGLLLFLGLEFLVEWTYDTWFKLSRTDYFLVILILVVAGTFGFLQGVGTGLVVAAVLFVVNYSRINVVKHTLSGVNYQSNVDRATHHRRLLDEKGGQLHILKLQGYIFFGTANNLFNQIRQRASDPDLEPLRFVVLDFRLVNGLDSSALNSFIRMRQWAQAQHINLVFTHLSPELRRQFEEGGYEKEDTILRIFPDLDHGIEYCEDQILIAEGTSLIERKLALPEQLSEALPESINIASLTDHLKRQDVPAGYTLMRQGDPPKGIYFIESGQVTAQLEREDGRTVRLRTMGAGTVVGELGLYLGYRASASVVTVQPSTIYHLSVDGLKQMEETDPEIAAAFHKFIVHLLGERLVNTNKTLNALLD